MLGDQALLIVRGDRRLRCRRELHVNSGGSSREVWIPDLDYCRKYGGLRFDIRLSIDIPSILSYQAPNSRRRSCQCEAPGRGMPNLGWAFDQQQSKSRASQWSLRAPRATTTIVYCISCRDYLMSAFRRDLVCRLYQVCQKSTKNCGFGAMISTYLSRGIPSSVDAANSPKASGHSWRM